MDGFFEKNIQFIKTYNSDLFDKLMNTPAEGFRLNTNLAGEYNLILENKPVHSVSGAEAEAVELFNDATNDTKNSMHVIFGIGLGYLFDVFASRAKGYVILFEPDLKVLKFVMETVDFSEILQKENVFVVSSVDELDRIYSDIFKYGFKTYVHALDFHKSVTASLYKQFSSAVDALHSKYFYNHQYQTEKMNSLLKSMFHSLDRRYAQQKLTDLKDLFKGKPAIIISAGPSLAQNIDTIKKYADNAVIFSVGTSLKTLHSNGITPDFLNYIEQKHSYSQYIGYDTKNINVITEPYTSAHALWTNFKRSFITTSYESNTNHLFAQLGGFEVGSFETKGTVSYHALSCAKLLGCSPIILVGQDLAYVDGKCYAQGSVYEELECKKDEVEGKYKIEPKDREKFKKSYLAAIKSEKDREILLERNLKKLNEGIRFIKGIDGTILPTSIDYFMFKSYLEEFAKNNASDTKLINSSSGALIEGFEHIALNEVMKEFAHRKIDVEGALCKIKHSPASSMKIVNANLGQAKKFLSKTQALAQKGLLMIEPNEMKNCFDEINILRMQNTMLRLLTLNIYTKTQWELRENEDKISQKYTLHAFFEQVNDICSKYCALKVMDV